MRFLKNSWKIVSIIETADRCNFSNSLVGGGQYILSFLESCGCLSKKFIKKTSCFLLCITRVDYFGKVDRKAKKQLKWVNHRIIQKIEIEEKIIIRITTLSCSKDA